jgi:hypothetical protein
MRNEVKPNTLGGAPVEPEESRDSSRAAATRAGIPVLSSSHENRQSKAAGTVLSFLMTLDSPSEEEFCHGRSVMRVEQAFMRARSGRRPMVTPATERARGPKMRHRWNPNDGPF